MATTDSVKRALAALATRTDTARGPYTAIIAEADAATADLQRAAGFVEAVGLDRLDAAIDAATAADEPELADRGREALRKYRTFRQAAVGGADGVETGNENAASGSNYATTGPENATTGLETSSTERKEQEPPR